MKTWNYETEAKRDARVQRYTNYTSGQGAFYSNDKAGLFFKGSASQDYKAALNLVKVLRG